jgi:hypothetical protein
MRRKGFTLIEAGIRVGVHPVYMTPKILIFLISFLLFLFFFFFFFFLDVKVLNAIVRKDWRLEGF